MGPRKPVTIIFTLLLIVCATIALAGGHGHKKEKKVGILLVAFGSSIKSAQISFENVSHIVVVRIILYG